MSFQTPTTALTWPPAPASSSPFRATIVTASKKWLTGTHPEYALGSSNELFILGHFVGITFSCNWISSTLWRHPPARQGEPQMIALIMALMAPSHARNPAEEPTPDSTPHFDYTFQVLRGSEVLTNVTEVQTCDQVAWIIHGQQRRGYMSALVLESDGNIDILIPTEGVPSQPVFDGESSSIGYFFTDTTMGTNQVILIWTHKPVVPGVLKMILGYNLNASNLDQLEKLLIYHFAQQGYRVEFDLHVTNTVPDSLNRMDPETGICSVNKP